MTQNKEYDSATIFCVIPEILLNKIIWDPELGFKNKRYLPQGKP